MNVFLSPKEDFRDWLINNWFHIEDTFGVLYFDLLAMNFIQICGIKSTQSRV